ncbi:GNAT family N-acetyltransferase [uncultured Tenacibaculum sp.]|uniref:GNAT family N-acetyltransferase n=1 Tax=uncultured Tenacibaculum sp. TaxID=174713 RepID=UPI00261B6053|nr:GNAT family N-acetyltransferase [uncultured Tenacibaculum sp.]
MLNQKEDKTIHIRKATETDVEVLALLGRITYSESHGHFINDKNDLLAYNNKAFSIAKIKEDIDNNNNLFYILYVNNLPVGYAKLVLNATHESITSTTNCRLERIYILNDFIPLKIGQQLLTFIESKAKELQLDTIWLSVYIKNERAIRFYKRNEFKDTGKLDFLVNGNSYENFVLSKKIKL